jgi:hypothetical protein
MTSRMPYSSDLVIRTDLPPATVNDKNGIQIPDLSEIAGISSKYSE